MRQLRTLARRLRNETGAIDLASIMVGVLVIGAVASTANATVTQVVPWAQNEAAKQNLAAVHDAQGAYRAQHAGYGNSGDLADATYLTDDGPVEVYTTADGSCFFAVAHSDAGSRYVTDSTDRDPRPFAGNSTPVCDGLTAGAIKNPPAPWKCGPGQSQVFTAGDLDDQARTTVRQNRGDCFFTVTARLGQTTLADLGPSSTLDYDGRPEWGNGGRGDDFTVEWNDGGTYREVFTGTDRGFVEQARARTDVSGAVSLSVIRVVGYEDPDFTALAAAYADGLTKLAEHGGRVTFHVAGNGRDDLVTVPVTPGAVEFVLTPNGPS